MGKTRRKFAPKWQYIGLATLAAVTAGVVSYASLSPTPDVPVVAAAPIIAPATTATIVDSAPVLASIKGMITGSEPIVISVLGDSTGNAKGEWVELWAQHLGAYGTVTLHQWDETTDAWRVQPIVVEGPERSITIWNASYPGANYTYPLKRMDAVQPEKPSFVIHNFGHNGAPQRADAGAMDLFAAVNTKWGAAVPAVVILQNPSRNTRELGTQGSVDALRDWAARAGHPTVDVNSAFTATNNVPALLADDVHPNPAGQQIWVDTVKAALG